MSRLIHAIRVVTDGVFELDIEVEPGRREAFRFEVVGDVIRAPSAFLLGYGELVRPVLEAFSKWLEET